MPPHRFHYRHLIPGKPIVPKPHTGGFRSGKQTDNAHDVYELAGVQNSTGTIEEIDALIRSDHLGPRDLVDLGQGWQSLQDCDEFAEACRPALRREQLSLMAKCAGAILLGVLWAVAMRYW